MVAQKFSLGRERTSFFLYIVFLLINGCSTDRGNIKRVPAGAPSDANGEHFFNTTFLQTENPLSEGGVWVEGSTAGASLLAGGSLWSGGRLWGNVQSDHGMAFGVDEPTKFGDPTAILAGTWGSTQTVTATVRVSQQPKNGCCHEVELRLRTRITSRSITGYEAYCSVLSDNPYCHIARWNGPNGSWWNFETGSSATYLADGDVITATASGANPTVITLYKNGQKLLEAVDTGAAGGGFGSFGPWTSGSPGIGFYDSHDRNWSSFGLTSFSATDSSSATILNRMGLPGGEPKVQPRRP